MADQSERLSLFMDDLAEIACRHQIRELSLTAWTKDGHAIGVIDCGVKTVDPEAPAQEKEFLQECDELQAKFDINGYVCGFLMPSGAWFQKTHDGTI